MKNTLNLERQLLDRARKMFDVGHFGDARTILTRLISTEATSDESRLAALKVMGEIDSEAGKYRRARKHYVIAMAIAPEEAELYYRFAQCIDQDPDADIVRGYKAIRKAVKLKNNDARYWVALGQMAIKMRRRKSARAAFARATKLVPTDYDVLGELVEGLSHIGLYKAAQKAIIKAQLRDPGDMGVRLMWQRFMFDEARRKQQDKKALPSPSILPFKGKVKIDLSEEEEMPSDSDFRTDRPTLLPINKPQLQRFKGPKKAK